MPASFLFQISFARNIKDFHPHYIHLCRCILNQSTVASMWSTAALCRGRIFMHSYLLHPLLFSVRVAVSELQENLSRNPIFIVTQGISPRFTKFFSTTLLSKLTCNQEQLLRSYLLRIPNTRETLASPSDLMSSISTRTLLSIPLKFFQKYSKTTLPPEE